MKKIFLRAVIVVLFLIPLMANAQITPQEKLYKAGSLQYFSLSAVDSLTTYLTESFDISRADGQTMYVWYDYVTPAGTGDTLKVSIQGYFPGLEATGTAFVLDTMYVVGQTTSTPVVRASSTFFSFFPYVKVKVENSSSANRDGTAFRWGLYAKTEDYVPTAQNFGNVRP